MRMNSMYPPRPSKVLHGGYRYTNARRGLTTDMEGVYVVPDDHMAEVASIYVSNHGQAPCDFSIEWHDKGSNSVTHLAWNFHLLTNMSISLLDAPLLLQAGDSLRARCSAQDSVDIMISLAEDY